MCLVTTSVNAPRPIFVVHTPKMMIPVIFDSLKNRQKPIFINSVPSTENTPETPIQPDVDNDDVESGEQVSSLTF